MTATVRVKFLLIVYVPGEGCVGEMCNGECGSTEEVWEKVIEEATHVPPIEAAIDPWRALTAEDLAEDDHVYLPEVSGHVWLTDLASVVVGFPPVHAAMLPTAWRKALVMDGWAHHVCEHDEAVQESS